MKPITKKRTIDIESEFIGKPVGPLQKKERKADLTDEIKRFLEEPITIDGIKCIMLKLSGYKKEHLIGSWKITIIHLAEEEYIIKIFTSKSSHKWFLGYFFMIELHYFSAKIAHRSILKQHLVRAIRKWCVENPKHVINLEKLRNRLISSVRSALRSFF